MLKNKYWLLDVCWLSTVQLFCNSVQISISSDGSAITKSAPALGTAYPTKPWLFLFPMKSQRYFLWAYICTVSSVEKPIE